MINWIKGKIAAQKLKKLVDAQPKPDVMDVLRSLQDAGFSQSAALAIINAICNLTN